jgi:hypothetical protein
MYFYFLICTSPGGLKGSSLPPTNVGGSALSAGVVLTVTIVWNTLPVYFF